MKEPSERDWLAPFNDYWHKACADCGHEFNGPKRASWCHLCNEQRKAGLAPKPKIGGRKTGKTEMQTATPSEDGWEVPKFDRRAIADRVNRMCVLMAGANTLNAAEFAVEECQSELERIVAAKDAEIARLRQHKNDYMEAAEETARALRNEINDHQEEIRRLDALVAELSAQPARQVGGDEHVAYKQHPAIIGYARKKELAPLLDRTQPDGSYIYIGLDHPACWEEEPPYDHLEPLYIGAALAPAAVVMPEYERNHAGLIVESVHSPWNAALDAAARLNRRAIPEGLLEKLAHCTDPDCCIAHARGELRALLGEDK